VPLTRHWRTPGARGDFEEAEAAVAEPGDDERRTWRLAAVAALTLVLIIPPLLSQFDRRGSVFGVPVIWVYLYLVWAAVIGLIAVTGGKPR
jgi:hypothetical protein